MEEFIHLNPKRERLSFSVLFLLIPVFLFVFLILVIFTKNKQIFEIAVSRDETTAVLGEETEVGK
ncbi:hypothetical protein ACFL15_00685 [Patescibacteria group bacterium]